MLTELFKTSERLKILYNILYEDEFTVMKVSKETGVSKGLVSRYLNNLKDENLLEKSGRVYSLKDDAQTRAIKILLNLDLIHLEILDHSWASSLGIYGSWASGTNTHRSDLDLWVKVNKYPSEYMLSKFSREMMKMTGNEVNLIVLTPDKLEILKKTDQPFYNSLLRNSIILKGEPLG